MEATRPPEDAGLDPADRARALGLIFGRHGREHVLPTFPTRVEIYRARTGMVEAWEAIAWLVQRSAFIIWRRDTNFDGRLKAKEVEPDARGCLDGVRVSIADRWTVEPVYEEESAPPVPQQADETFLRTLDLGLTEPNSAQLAKLGKKPDSQ